MIIHKYGTKLEEASLCIDDLESRLEAAKQVLTETNDILDK